MAGFLDTEKAKFILTMVITKNKNKMHKLNNFEDL